jgi:FixJ family two-component response regulator
MFEDAAEEPAVDPLHELVDVLNEARANGLAQSDIDFLCRLVTSGKPDVLARQMNVTPRTVRNHREAILHRVRNAVAIA